MDNWYYAFNGAQVGPVSQAALQQLIAGGQVPTDSLVWCTGMAEWVPASTLPQLLAVATPSPAITQPVIGYGVGASAYVNPDMNSWYAGFWLRFAGGFIDGVITNVASKIVGTIAGFAVSTSMGPGNNNAVAIAGGIGGIAGLFIGWLYSALMQSSSIQGTVGMMVVGIKVTDLNGYKLTFGRATGRYFAAILSVLICGIGYLMMLWSPRKQTLHDQIAGTVVLRKNPPAAL